MEDLRFYAPILHTGFANTYNREQMERFTQAVYDLGYSGFSVEGKSYPLTTDVPGWIESFMHCVGMVIEESEKRGVKTWLFDEWGYPTSNAAGLTLDGHTQWRSKMLHKSSDLPLEQGQEVCIPVPEHFLAATVWPVGRDIFGPSTGETTVLAPADGYIRYTCKTKRERLVITTWEYDCFRVRSVFAPDEHDDRQGTVDILCHEAMDYFISIMHERYLKAFGPHFGKTVAGFFYDEPYISFPFAWTFDIFEEFTAQKGYDITPYLGKIVANMREANPQIADYRDVVTDRLAEAFYGKLSDWCADHGVEMIGHQDLDHDAQTLDSVSGHFFKNMSRLMTPGVDYIGNQIYPGTFCDYPRFAGSARRLHNKAHAMSETGAMGAVDPDFRRWAMEYQIIRGIDRFILMIADPVPEANVFNGPMSITHPQARFVPTINHRVARTVQMMAQGRGDAKVGIYLDLEESFLRQLMLEQPHTISYRPHPWENPTEVARLLCHAPVDYEYIWSEVLMNYPVEDGAIVLPSGQRLDTIIVSFGWSANKAMVERLGFLADAGVKVIAIARPNKELYDKVIFCDTPAEVLQHVASPVELEAKNSEISLITRKWDDKDVYFMLNEGWNGCDTCINFKEDGYLLAWDHQSETWVDVGTTGIYHYAYEPMELKIFAVAKAPVGVCAAKPAADAAAVGGWTLTLPDGKTIDLGEKLGDWREHYDPCYSGYMTYATRIAWDEDSEAELDLGRVGHAAMVIVNGAEYPVPFKPYKVRVKQQIGENEVRVDVLNSPANEMGGTRVGEFNGKGRAAWIRMLSQREREYLPSGLMGPVTITKLK